MTFMLNEMDLESTVMMLMTSLLTSDRHRSVTHTHTHSQNKFSEFCSVFLLI